MCYVCQRSPVFRANQRLVTKDQLTSQERRILERFEREFADVLTGPQETLVSRIRSGDVDPSRIGRLRAEVMSSFDEHSGAIQSVYRSNIEDGVRTGRVVAANRYALEGSFDQVPERLYDELSDWALESANEVVDTMSDEITNVLQSGVEEGMSIDEISDVLQEDVFQNRLKRHRAERIARTETNAASNAGSHSAYEDSGAIGEEWLSMAGDSRTRESHEDANGQVVGVDTPFLVGGSEIDHPGDKSAPIEEWINCRCTIAPVMSDQIDESDVDTIMNGGRLTGGV